jgi:hypothetical protein
MEFSKRVSVIKQAIEQAELHFEQCRLNYIIAEAQLERLLLEQQAVENYK